MNPMYFDVATLLNDELSSLTLGSNLFGGEWNADTDKQVLCVEGVGAPSDHKQIYEQPSVQILVRGDKGQPDYRVYNMAKEISDFLLQQSECVTINNTDYKGFEVGSTIGPLGKDENERFSYSMNFFSWRNAF